MNRLRKLTFAAALIIFGVMAALCIAEGALRLWRGAPRLAAPDRDQRMGFYWQYVDIYDPFFARNDAGWYVCQRPHMARAKSFPAKKAAGETRICVLGESMAELVDLREKKFLAKLRECMPDRKWRIINCGVGGYDIYRIKLIAREIVGYQPDLVVILAGNNNIFRPLTVNHWKYKYSLIRHSWTLQAITDRLCPALIVSEEDKPAFYQRNLKEIISLFTGRNIPVALVTLPRNTRIAYFDDLFDGNRETFRSWWLWQYDQAAFCASGGQGLIGQAMANLQLGRRDVARRLFQAHVSELYSSRRYGFLRARNDMARECARTMPGVCLVDFENIVMDMAGGCPGFEIFTDSMHVWPPLYDVLFDELISTVYGVTPRISRLADVKEEARVCMLQSVADDLKYADYLDQDLLGCLQLLPFAYRKNMCAFAIKPYEEILGRTDPARYRNALMIGETLREQGRCREALAFFAAAMRNNEKDHRAWLLRAICHYQLRDAVRCREDLAELHRLNPKFRWLTWEFFSALPGGTGPNILWHGPADIEEFGLVV